jgi:microcystin-dependent protein
MRKIFIKSMVLFFILGVFTSAPNADAQEPYLGEIRMFAGIFPPRGWAFCDGQMLAVSQHDALFSLLGTIYGGDGRTTFALPDLRGRVPIHMGQGPGLSDRRIGSKGGSEQVTLTIPQIPSHTHQAKAGSGEADDISPAGNVWGEKELTKIYQTGTVNVNMNSDAILNTGGSQSHDNMVPFQGINYIIALVGVFPSD